MRKICQVKSISKKPSKVHDINALLFSTPTDGGGCGGVCCGGEVQQKEEEEEGEDPAL